MPGENHSDWRQTNCVHSVDRPSCHPGWTMPWFGVHPLHRPVDSEICSRSPTASQQGGAQVNSLPLWHGGRQAIREDTPTVICMSALSACAIAANRNGQIQRLQGAPRHPAQDFHFPGGWVGLTDNLDGGLVPPPGELFTGQSWAPNPSWFGCLSGQLNPPGSRSLPRAAPPMCPNRCSRATQGVGHSCSAIRTAIRSANFRLCGGLGLGLWFPPRPASGCWPSLPLWGQFRPCHAGARGPSVVQLVRLPRWGPMRVGPGPWAR